ncbi:hypothetical protein [Dyadobacter luticola]|uniref:Uncharacterized protein n=1 Tax=Dyadobacter luticola TaxID=1979387 RepID=A0A5R9KW25_9BACT|nr:hypothetical protein [Dyadobacter luticola]TLV00340.1 hypothetical protein FEN17_12650 [Dyadobacter luticola]
MLQIELIKSFLKDDEIQKKYGLTPTDVDQMSMTSKFSLETQTFVNLVTQMVKEVEDQNTTTNSAAARLNAHLENALR